MDQIDQRQKSLVFCATQDHAARVRNAINQIKDNPDPHYCERVTADDGKLGEQHLREFQDNEKTLPTILTTSGKLSTGVDARNVRNIVLLRPITSMIEFKQIIGRGTRTFDGKDFFTIYDFVKGYERFNDPEWDGEPLPPDEPNGPKAHGNPEGLPPPTGGVKDTPEPVPKIIVKLADGKERSIRYLAATTYWHEGRQIMNSAFGILVLSTILTLSGCVTLSGNYKVSLQSEPGEVSTGSLQIFAQGSGIYSAINALCINHPGAIVVVRNASTGQELKSESPHKCR